MTIEKQKQAGVIQELLLREKAEQSFYEFVKQAWHLIEGPENPFIGGWHLQALAEHLEALLKRQIRKLIINMPPRCSKSSFVSVFLCPWAWLHYPTEKFFYAAYSYKLTVRDSIRSRRILESNWYQNRWGDKFQLRWDVNNQARFESTAGGSRIITSFKGFSMGEGGSVRCLDDPNGGNDALSELEREAKNEFVSGVWNSRGINPATDVQLVMQQRVHHVDVTGFLLDSDDANSWTKLILPLEYESSRKCKTIILPSANGKVWEDPRTVEGETLWPERFGPAEIAELKASYNSAYKVAGQLQQRPSPESGSILKKGWFKWWKYTEPPPLLQTIMSIDTALDANIDSENCYSAFSTWGLFEDDHKILNLILLSLYREKLEYPDLRKMAQRMSRNYLDDKLNDPTPPHINNAPDMILVEAKVTGLALIKDLQRAGVVATRFDPNKFGDKIMRVRLVSHLIEAGRVWVPAKGPSFTRLKDYAELLVEHCAMFPVAESRDIVDTMTQVLLRLQASGYLSNTTDQLFTTTSESTSQPRRQREYY